MESSANTLQQELSKPLLDDIETAVLLSEAPVPQELIATEETSVPCGDCCETQDEFYTPSCWDQVILWLVLPTLLFVQFAISFIFQHEATPHQLQWSTVNWSIALFVVASYLFRRTLQDHSMGYAVAGAILFLLPEIIMDVLLGFILFGYVETAFLTMVSCTVALSSYVVVQSLYTLCQARRAA